MHYSFENEKIVFHLWKWLHLICSITYSMISQKGNFLSTDRWQKMAEPSKLCKPYFCTCLLMSVRLWKMVGPKMQDFCPRINMLKGKCFNTILQWIMVRQKVLKSYFQSQFSKSKIDRICSKKNSFKNINLGDHFL